MREHVRVAISIFPIVLVMFFSLLPVNMSRGETSSISGYVIDARTGLQIQGALVTLNSERSLITDSRGYFSFSIAAEGWYSIYAFCDHEETVGTDYVPSCWRIYLEKGTNAYKVLSLWPGASIEIEGEIRFVEKSMPASWFKFKVQPPGGSVWGDSSSVSEYGSIDSSEDLRLDLRLIIVPADTHVTIVVETWVPDDLYRTFTIQNDTDYILRQGDHKTVNIEEYCLKYNLESVQGALNLSLDLLQRAENVGFLVKAEQKDVRRALTLLNASEAATRRGSYEEAFTLLRNAYISAKDVTSRLQGLFDISLPSALILTSFFAFISLALTYLLVERGTGLEISSSLKGQHSITISLRALYASLSYILILSIFFMSFPGCHLVSFSAFSLAAGLYLICASLLVVLGSRLLEAKKSENRSISFGSAIVIAFSIAGGNLRRRKLRTTLNILCLMTLVFGFIVFTSISPSYGFVSRTLGRSEMSLDALMVVNPSVKTETKFIPLTEDLIAEMENRPNVTLVVPKAENLPSLASLSHLIAPSGKSSPIHGVIGVVPRVESEITHLNATIIKGQYLNEKNVNEVLISESLSRHLETDVKSSVTVFGRDFTVVGIFDDKALEEILEMSGEAFLPSRLQATPGGVYLTQCWSDEIVITNLETALTLPNIAISRVYVQIRNPEDLLDLADMIALTRGYSVWISFQGTLYEKYVGSYLEEKGMSLTPFLTFLGILIIGSTMFRSVDERRRSIFTLSSIGLNPTHIAALFLAESIVIGFIAGGLGYLLGVLGYRTIGLLSALEVREKVSSEWSLIALLFSTLTAVLATVIPAVKASTVVTPSHLRRWRPEQEEKPRQEGEPWTVELPVKIRPREVDFFFAHIERRLRDLADGSVERVEKVKSHEEDSASGPAKRVTFDYFTGETRRQLHTNNEITIERSPTNEYFKARLYSFPDRNFEEAVLRTSALVRRFIFEWNAQKVAVVTPFESTLNQLYSLVHHYNPETLYVVTETDVSGSLEPLKKVLEKEGMRVPRIFMVQMRSLDLGDCARIAEDLVLKAGIVCVSGDSAVICVALTVAATKLRKKMCHVVPISHQLKDPFQVSKVVTVD